MKQVFKTLQVFDNSIEARLFSSKLESEGVNCFLENESTMSLDPLLNYAIGGVRVTVLEEDYEVALSFAKEYSKKPIIEEDGQVVSCPICDSEQIQSGYSDVRDAKSLIGLLLGFAFFVVPFLARDKYNCTNCNHVFQKKENK